VRSASGRAELKRLVDDPLVARVPFLHTVVAKADLGRISERR
jgi:hypothetical protein